METYYITRHPLGFAVLLNLLRHQWWPGAKKVRPGTIVAVG